MVAQLEGAFLEMPRGWSFGLDVPLRVTGGKPLGMTDSDYHAQHTKVALYPHSDSSCSVAISLHGYRSMGINSNERR